MATDPYGNLEYSIGSEDDFWCFDYEINQEDGTVTLHAVINSETGHFIEDSYKDTYPIETHSIIDYVHEMFDEAHEWCIINGINFNYNETKITEWRFINDVSKSILNYYYKSKQEKGD
jgi:hypothetical protein